MQGATVIEVDNPVLRALRDDRVAIGIGVRLARTVDIAKSMKKAGYD
jgi:hypothetical protein